MRLYTHAFPAKQSMILRPPDCIIVCGVLLLELEKKTGAILSVIAVVVLVKDAIRTSSLLQTTPSLPQSLLVSARQMLHLRRRT